MSRAYAVRAWQVLTWRHWAWATGLGVLLGVLVPLQNLHLNFYFTLSKITYEMPFFVVFAWVFLLAVAAVEASVPRPRLPSLWRYLCGAVAAGLACVALAWGFSGEIRLPPKRVISGGSSMALKTYSPQHRLGAAVFEIGFDGVVHGFLATFIYAGLRRSLSAARVLADAELGRSEAQRSLIAARLVAAETHVDPEVVMQRLETIERAYESDPAAADGQLDELIAFLRDAIPRWRTDPA